MNLTNPVRNPVCAGTNPVDINYLVTYVVTIINIYESNLKILSCQNSCQVSPCLVKICENACVATLIFKPNIYDILCCVLQANGFEKTN